MRWVVVFNVITWVLVYALVLRAGVWLMHGV